MLILVFVGYTGLVGFVMRWLRYQYIGNALSDGAGSLADLDHICPEDTFTHGAAILHMHLCNIHHTCIIISNSSSLLHSYPCVHMRHTLYIHIQQYKKEVTTRYL